MSSALSQTPEFPVSGNYNQPLSEFITAVQDQYKIKIFFRPEWIVNLRVRGNYQNTSALSIISETISPVKLKLVTYSYGNYVVLPDQGFVLPEDTSGEIDTGPAIVNVGSVARASGGIATLNGYIKDGENGETIVGATVYALNLEKGVATNEFGFYSLELPTGRHRLRVSFLGYEDEIREINVRSSGSLDMELFEGLTTLSTVTVTGDAPDENVRGVSMGVQKINIQTIKKLPSLMGEVDVVKSLVLLPGVTTVGEGASGYNVRGGSVGENLILQDGAEVFNSSHLFGFFSAFNPDIVKGLNLYKGGGIPANLGGRLSSILDVQLRDGNFKKLEGNGGVGLLMSRLMLEGPIQKDKSSFIVGGRGSYSDWILSQAKDLDLKQSEAGFYDANIKITQEINSNNKLYLTGYISNDRFKLANDTTFNFGSRIASLKWNHVFSDNIFSSTTATVGQYKYNVKDDAGINQFEMDASIDYKAIDTELELDFIDKHNIVVGGRASLYEVAQGDLIPLAGSPNSEVINVPAEKALESAIYIADEWEMTRGVTVSAGLRYSDFRNLGAGEVYLYDENLPKTNGSITDTLTYSDGELIASYGGFEPRLGIRVALGSTSSVKASYNRMRQYMHLVSNTVAVTPIDVWQLSNTHIRPAVSNQYSIGYFRNFNDNNIETSVEAYYKQTQDILDYKAGATLLLNETLEADLLQGQGRARGIEFLIKKKNGKVTGWLSYTYSRTELKAASQFSSETVNNGAYYPANYDKPHDLTIVMDYQLGKRVNFTANFTYSTGRPITVPTATYQLGPIRSLADYSGRNQYRIPDFHRLDLSLTIGRGFKKSKRVKSEWNISVYNVYGRKNAYSVFFNENSRAYKLSILSIIPSVSYNFKFQ
jgi:hypothetical protein